MTPHRQPDRPNRPDRTPDRPAAAGGNAGNPERKSRPPHHLSYRSRHRAASHDAAHDADADIAPGDLPSHPLVPRNAADLIVDDDALAALVDHLRAAGQFAYDTEFIGELTYHPQLCLVQVATAERVALIDPLAGVNLTPFWLLLADPSVEKLVHAGPQDVEPVFRHVGKPAANVFDTQIAAGFCAMAYPVALGKLVGEVLGHRMVKGHTFTDWQRRPLSASQLRYAADDVRFLPAVVAELRKRMEPFGHADWAAEECAAMCDPARYSFDPESDFLRIRGAGTLTVAQLGVLRELMIWRERCAVEADCPPRSYVRDEPMLDMARHPPKSVDRLQKIKFLPRPVVERHGEEIVRLTLAALAHPPAGLRRPPHAEPTPSERFRAESVWAAAQAICLSQGIDPAAVASRQDVADFDRAWAARDPAALAEGPLMKGWRAKALGDRLTALLQGQSDLSLRWQAGRLTT